MISTDNALINPLIQITFNEGYYEVRISLSIHALNFKISLKAACVEQAVLVPQYNILLARIKASLPTEAYVTPSIFIVILFLEINCHPAYVHD
jgi:hypothetical protein